MTEVVYRWLLLCNLMIWPLLAGAESVRNVCALPGSSTIEDGLGGTGHTGGDEGEGLGGTGLAPGDGVGGTGRFLAWLFDGLGGTGHREDGVGGTGRPRQGLRIRGVVTGFGSVCVNGLEVQYSPTTPVRIDGRDSTVGDLALGQVVDILARKQGPVIRAEQVWVLRQLMGRVESVDADTGRVRIDGVMVKVPSRAAGIRAAGLRRGDAVMVSGMQQADGALYATRIDPAPRHPVRHETAPPLRQGLAVIQGVVAQTADDQVRLADGSVIRLSSETSAPTPGTLATIVVEIEDSRWTSRALAVSGVDDLHHLTGRAVPVDAVDRKVQPRASGDSARSLADGHETEDTEPESGMPLDEQAAADGDQEPNDAIEAPEPWNGHDEAEWVEVPEPIHEPEVPEMPEEPEVPALPDVPDPPEVPDPPDEPDVS